MCGIAGILSKDPGLVTEQRIRNSTNCLKHRGPEGEGIWFNPQKTIALGHRRLGIIDLSPAAAQPMIYEHRYAIIHNGEIYNYLELREELKAKGSSFNTQSDTEVIAAAYAVWGKECVNRFDGMFAFVIWDEKEQQLFAARDRVGEKPFFFSFDEEQFVFASEMKSLWTMGVEKEVNEAMLYNFLTIGYTSNPSNPVETFYNNINQLPPASYLSCGLSKQPEIGRYWTIYPEINKNIKDDEAIDTFINLFSASVTKRLRSDVSIGTSLSGGLDSATVVAFCEELSSEKYSHKCFTASFPGFEKDETTMAKKLASQFGLEHHLVTIDVNSVPALMEKLMGQQEIPFSSASVLAQYAVFENAKENGVTVLLDGQGADEVLAGYHRYYKWFWQELYRDRHLRKSGELKKARALGVKESFGWQNRMASLLPEFATAILTGKKIKRSSKDITLHPDFAFKNKSALYYSTPTFHDLNGVLYFNSFVNGLEELLRLADRNSMAHGLEVRLPFLNHELLEFLFTLPSNYKIRDGWTKWILRKSVEKKLPKEITWSSAKTGFEPPQKKWMEDQFVSEAIIAGKKILVEKNILSPSVLQKKIQPHESYAAENKEWKYWSASFLFD